MPGPDDDAPHRHTRSNDGYAPHEHSRTGEAAIGDNTTITLKTAIALAVAFASIVGTNLRSEMARSSMRYELEAKIVAVQSGGDTRMTKIEGKLAQIQATNCAIARSLHVVTVECGNLDP